MTRSVPRVALVLPGGGARGAYEAGALSVLLPALEARGERVSIVCGTSVGAINAAVVGSLADRPAREATAEIVERWLAMRRGDVLRTIVSPRLPLQLLRAAGELLEVPGLRLPSFLDPAPLKDSLDRWIDWMALHRNVKHGLVDAVCVVATSISRGRPVAFVETTSGPPSSPPSSQLHYVGATLEAQHVRASAAIPLLFPPVEVTSPAAAADHYIDGGTRLNAPLAPALALGADRVVVIGFEPFAGRPERARVRAPRLADVTANVLDGLLVDQVADDLHRLAAINSFFVEGASTTSARSYRASQEREPYRKVSYALVAPAERGAIGAIAASVLAERYGGWRQFRDPDYLLLSRLLGNGPSRGELLSFLLFDEVFIAELVAAGRADAQRWLDRHPAFWCSDAAHDLGLSPGSAAARDAVALSEFRARRR